MRVKGAIGPERDDAVSVQLVDLLKPAASALIGSQVIGLDNEFTQCQVAHSHSLLPAVHYFVPANRNRQQRYSLMLTPYSDPVRAVCPDVIPCDSDRPRACLLTGCERARPRRQLRPWVVLEPDVNGTGLTSLNY